MVYRQMEERDPSINDNVNITNSALAAMAIEYPVDALYMFRKLRNKNQVGPPDTLGYGGRWSSGTHPVRSTFSLSCILAILTLSSSSKVMALSLCPPPPLALAPFQVDDRSYSAAFEACEMLGDGKQLRELWGDVKVRHHPAQLHHRASPLESPEHSNTALAHTRTPSCPSHPAPGPWTGIELQASTLILAPTSKRLLKTGN